VLKDRARARSEKSLWGRDFNEFVHFARKRREENFSRREELRLRRRRERACLLSHQCMIIKILLSSSIYRS
jgi:hypothetical protein